eukprot:TRINITY_DN3239_c1_g2_i1.p1 TRINITY_DN3239_c1_g2~~TRINITY_DN3239_c1_g2_i1.p1  ORF type:complete len:872 (+),score=327.96 TRINITY_DN3239_c1_g2_i1:84-2699(+)
MLRATALSMLALLPCIAAGQEPAAPRCDSFTQLNVQLQWIHQAQFAGFFAAVENGFYEDECLQVSVKAGGPGVNMLAELKERRAEFAVGWMSVLVGGSSGRTTADEAVCGNDLPTSRFTNLMQHFQRSGYSHVQWKDSGLKTIPDLKGKKVGYWPGLDAEILAALAHYNITDDVTMQRIDFTVNPFLQKKVDSMPVMTYNELALILQARNEERSQAAGTTVLNQMNDLELIDLSQVSHMLQDGVLASHDWLDEGDNKDIAQRFITASMRGWVWCRDNEEDAVNLLFAGAAHQRWQMREVNRLIWPTNLTVPQQGFETTVSTMRAYNLLNNSDPTLPGYLQEGGVFVSDYVIKAAETLRTKYGVDPEAEYPEQDHIKLCPAAGGGKGFRVCPPPEPPLASDDTMLFVIIIICIVGVVLVLSVATALVMRAKAAKRREMTKFAPKSGNVALIFTDIKKSSELWGKFPDEMVGALATHHSICRTLIKKHKGYEVKTIGDAFMCAFADPAKAVEFMMDFQLELLNATWPDVLSSHEACKIECDAEGKLLFSGLRVRAGCHMGVVNVRETPQGGYDYDGADVNIAARVSDAGGGGQLVITEAVYRAIEADLEDLCCQTAVEYISTFTFKGIADPQTVYQISPESLKDRTFEAMRGVTPYEPQEDKEMVVIRDQSGSNSHSLTLTQAAGHHRQTMAAIQTIRRWVGKFGVKGVPPQELALTFRMGCDGLNMTETQVIGIVLSHFVRVLENPPPRRRQRQVEVEESGSTLPSNSTSNMNVNRSYAKITGLAPNMGLRWPETLAIIQTLPQPSVIAIAEALNEDSAGGVGGRMQSMRSFGPMSIPRLPSLHTPGGTATLPPTPPVVVPVPADMPHVPQE